MRSRWGIGRSGSLEHQRPQVRRVWRARDARVLRDNYGVSRSLRSALHEAFLSVLRHAHTVDPLTNNRSYYRNSTNGFLRSAHSFAPPANLFHLIFGARL